MMVGANMIYGPGDLGCGMTMDYGQIVVGNEAVRMWRAAAKGIPVNDYTLAVDVINEVGPRGHFLMEDHTMENLHSQSLVELFNRGPREIWESEGGKPLEQRATEMARQIIAEHKPKPLSSNVIEKMDEIIEEAKKLFC